MNKICVFKATFPDGYIISSTKHDKFNQQVGWHVNVTKTPISDVKFNGEVLTQAEYRDKYITSKEKV